MKAKQMSVLTGNRILIPAVVIMLMTSFSSRAQTAETYSATTPSVGIRHIGNSANNMFFRLQIDNSTEEKLTVSVRNASGENLFAETSSEKKYLKTFQVPKDLAAEIYFYVWSAKDRKPQRYEVRTATRAIEEVIVDRID